MNTKEGGRKFIKTMIKKHGSYEAYRKHMREIAKVGVESYREQMKEGIAKPRGFAANRELASEAGKIGGKISKRGKAKEERNESI